MKVMKDLLKRDGREIIADRVILGACFESMTLAATKKHAEKLAGADAIMALTCASGMKMITNLNPGIPIVQPVDTTGHGAIVITPLERDRGDELVANSPCVSCEHCVISYTGGICPVTACPSQSLYEPCDRAPGEGGGTRCIVNPERDCAWVEIRRIGWDLEGLKGLKRIHSDYGIRPSSYGGKAATVPSPEWLRRFGGWFLAMVPQSWSKLAQYIF